MKACCQRCGAWLPERDGRFHPVCMACDEVEGAWLTAAYDKAQLGRKAQTGLASIPETARRGCWWTQGPQLEIGRERYASQ